MKTIFTILFLSLGFSPKAIFSLEDTIIRRKDAVPIVQLQAGDKMPDFNLEDIDGKQASLKIFKGKYVLIDVWATWCGVCLDEAPFFERLENKFHHKKIAFVSISADTHRNIWVKMIKSKETKIPQWRLPEGEDSPLLAAFGIEGIPRFILLDKKGRILNTMCGMPSKPEIGKMLSELKGI